MPDIWIDVDTAVTIPVNKVPIVASSDGFTTDETIAWNESGMDLNWNFVTTAGVQTQTNVSPTTTGDYDWTHVGNAMYKIEMTASGGVSANNDAEGFGWFSGKADAICPFSGPIIGFRAAALNNALIDGGDILDVSVTQIDGNATNGNNATLNLKKLNIVNNAGDALVASSTGSNGHGIKASGNGSGEGLSATGGVTGEGIEAIGGATSGAGIRAAASANNDAGMELVKHGTGKDLDADETDSIKTTTDKFVFTVANQVDSNVIGISSDNTAANNLESEYDGTGYIHILRGTNIALNTTLAVRTSDTVFTIAAGSGDNDAYNNMVLGLYDVTGTLWQTRKIDGYVGAGKTVTVDTAFTFVVANGDYVRIFLNAYAPTVAAGGGATAQQVHEYVVTGITTPGQAGYEIQQRGGSRYG